MKRKEPTKAKPAKKRKLAVRDDILKLTEVHPNHNADITAILYEMGTIQKNLGQRHKYTAYTTAVASLALYPRRIESGDVAQKVMDGVGKKIGIKIQEILDTGKLKKLEQYREDEKIQALNLLCRVTGVGPAAALKWVEAGVRTIEDLKKQKLTHHQEIGVRYFDDFEKRIPRAEMDEMVQIVKQAIKELDPKIKAKCCGSYRRGSPQSGDLDILVTHPDFDNEEKEKKNSDILKRIVARLHKKKFIIDDISEGQHQYMGVCKLPQDEETPARRVDIKLFPIESFYTALLHFTGSGEHNRQLSCIAINKGFKLSEYSLVPVGSTGEEGNPLPITSEKDIYAMLGIPYRKPSERNI